MIKQLISKFKLFVGAGEDRLDRFEKKTLLRKIEVVYRKAKEQHPQKHIYLLSDLKFKNYPLECEQVSSVERVKKDLKDCVFLVFFKSDDDYEEPLRSIRDGSSIFYAIPIERPVASYIDKNKKARRALECTRADCSSLGLGKFSKEDFENIMQVLEITRKVDGDYVEIGVFKGSSGIAALHYMVESGIKRKCWFIDTFEGFSYKVAERSFDRRWFDTHQLWGKKKTMEHIRRIFGKFDIPHQVVAANICDSRLPRAIKKIAACNIDVDIYDAVLASLKKISPLISEHGVMMVEDYGHTPGLIGAHLAVEEFLVLDKEKKFTPIYMESGQIFLIRNK